VNFGEKRIKKKKIKKARRTVNNNPKLRQTEKKNKWEKTVPKTKKPTAEGKKNLPTTAYTKDGKKSTPKRPPLLTARPIHEKKA